MTLDSFLHSYGDVLSVGSIVSLVVALSAGIVSSAVCPCTLPVGLGMAGMAGASEGHAKKTGFLVAFSFFLGIVVNLVALSALAGRLGAVLTESFGTYWALWMAAVSLIAAAAAFLGPRLKIETLSAMRKPGLLGAFGYGFIFSLGTSAAPFLLLLTVAAAQGKPLYGMALALAFGVGRGAPFLLAGVFAGAVMRFARLSSFRRGVQMMSGFALVFVSFYYFRSFLTLVSGG